MQYRAARGMRDVLPDEIPFWERLEGAARRLAMRSGYREIRPPLMEETDLFIRSVGEVTDIVEKEMFTLKKGDSSLTLRPEGTAGIARAYVQAGWARNAPIQKLFHIGPMFRYERPQKGRERQFTQFDVECIGTADPRIDAEVIDLAAGFFEELEIRGLEVRINSMGDGDDRDRYREAVRAFLGPRIAEHCDLCKSRFERNVLRVLDCKNEACKALHAGAPHLLDFLSDENRAHFDAVRGHLESIGRTAVVDPGIVRGLDYYTRTIFEVHYPALGARSALCGGGRYDHLVRDLGGPDVPAVGFAVGFSSTMLVMKELGLADGLVAQPAEVYVVAADPSLRDEVFAIVGELRRAGISTVFDSEDRSLKSQVKAAGKAGHPALVVLGPDELAAGTAQLKDMARREQVDVPRADLVERVRALLEQA